MAMVGGAFSGVGPGLYRRAPDRHVVERVSDEPLAAHVLVPRPGWFILHAIAIALVFMLGYVVKF